MSKPILILPHDQLEELEKEWARRYEEEYLGGIE